jgi:molybdopterin molybdotransferase
VCAALGFPELAVVRRPRVAVLATGDELREPGERLHRGQIWSSNPYTIAALARDAGAEVQVLPRVHDDVHAIVAALRGVDDVDAIVITGGVSGGDYDFTRDALASLGVQLDFWKVRMKPGKPVAVGRWPGGPTVFGLPGNPVSCAVTFQVFVRPWLQTRLGVSKPFLPIVDAYAADDMPSEPGRARFERVTLKRTAGVFSASSAGSSSSGVLSAFARSHGLLLLAPDAAGPRAGEVARVMLLDPSFLDGERAEFGF